MLKRLTFAGYDHAGPHIFPIEADREEAVGHIKLARPLPPRVEQYIRTAKPIPGKTQLLIDALGAGEYWGENANGDYFPEVALRHDGDDYGFKTFERLAYPFKNHLNTSPAHALGDRVALADYDPVMHRVVLIVALHNDKAQDILADLDAGKYWDVSMGCFTAETLVTMGDGTRKRIDHVVDGEWVLTHRGRPRRVTRVHRRRYQGDLFCIRAEAHETLRCTSEHPFLAIDGAQILENAESSHRRWRKEPSLSPSWVHARCLDRHLLLEPVLDEVVTPDYVDRAFARLFGYYLAEGHVLRNKRGAIVGMELTTHCADPVHNEIDELCREFGTKNRATRRAAAKSEVCVHISIFDERLANLCYEHGGGYAKRKRLSDSAMRWHPVLQRELLGAFANGDGCGFKTGALILSTASDSLAWQFMALLPRLGIVASIHNLEHKAGSGFSAYATYEWVIHIGKQWAQGLRDVCAKVVRSEIRKRKQSRRLCRDKSIDAEYVVTPVREINAFYVETEVFNLEVDEDESYVAGGLAVHNCRVPFDECSICGNRARTRADYCADLRYRMRQILPDGRRVRAINWHPRFFDISPVRVGAEKASHVLQKVAFFSLSANERGSSAEEGERVYGKLATQLKASATKEADIDKEVPSNLPAAQSVRSVDGTRKAKILEVVRGAGALKAREPALPGHVLDQLASFPLGTLASTLTSLALPLKPEEFQRIILVHIGQRPLAEKLARTGVVFDEHQVADAVPIWARPLKRFDAAQVNEQVALLLQPYLGARSGYPEPLRSRLERIEKVAEADDRTPLIYNRQWYPRGGEAARPAGASGFVPAALALAAGYLLLKRQFPQLAESGPLAMISRHPWLLPILLAGGVGAGVGLHNLIAPKQINDASSVDAMKPGFYDARSKVASIDAPWMRLGFTSMIYLLASIRKEAGERGALYESVDGPAALLEQRRDGPVTLDAELEDRLMRFGMLCEEDRHDAHAR